MSPANPEVNPLPLPLPLPPDIGGQLCHLNLIVPLVVGGTAITDSDID